MTAWVNSWPILVDMPEWQSQITIAYICGLVMLLFFTSLIAHIVSSKNSGLTSNKMKRRGFIIWFSGGIFLIYFIVFCLIFFSNMYNFAYVNIPPYGISIVYNHYDYSLITTFIGIGISFCLFFVGMFIFLLQRKLELNSIAIKGAE